MQKSAFQKALVRKLKLPVTKGIFRLIRFNKAVQASPKIQDKATIAFASLSGLSPSLLISESK
eukprot:snap_masked-scaffold_74-processed-gene-0.48-mRNA-1 protein AED:1.00 eAED:1.00 QI:0/-1/0/0/-1/1/1/0/62